MSNDKFTKKELAEKLGISRPTLDTYLENGFPDKIKDRIKNPILWEGDIEYQKIKLENEIRLKEYELKKLKEKLESLQNETKE